mgnify:CR=1 FL=1
MKARLIKTKDNKLRLLCEDGTLAICSKVLLFDFLTKFNKINFSDGNAGRWNEEFPDMISYPGKTLAYITDSKNLVVNDISPFSFSIFESPDFLDYLSTEEYAKRHNVSSEIVKVYCRDGRIEGAKKIGGRWAIPETAPYPVEDASRKPTAGPRKKRI